MALAMPSMVIGQSQQPEDIASETMNYTEPAAVNGTGYIPHIDSETFPTDSKRFQETKNRIRREIAHGLRANFPRIRALVTEFKDEEGFVRNGIVFCGGEHDQRTTTGSTSENFFPLPADFGPDTGSLTLIDGWSKHDETYRATSDADLVSTQCDISNCLEGSFVKILSRFIRSSGYIVQDRDICQAVATKAPVIEARTCNLKKYPVERKAYECDRNVSNYNLDWWQVNKQCYGLAKDDCVDSCAWDEYERFCRASEVFMNAEEKCREKETETISVSEYVNEVWRVLGYSVNGELQAIPTTDKALVTGAVYDTTKKESKCTSARAFIHALNGNAQINAFRDLGIEEAVAQWEEELKGVRSYLKSMISLLQEFYSISLSMFPNIENEELEECPMGEVELNGNIDSGTKEAPLCQQNDFQSSDKLNRINEGGQSMIRGRCFCRNGNLDSRFSEINWATGEAFNKDWKDSNGDLTYSECQFVAAVGDSSAKCQVRTNDPANAECSAMDGSTDAKTPSVAADCEKLTDGKVYQVYNPHEFDQIYLEPNPNIYVVGGSGTTGGRDIFDCNRFKNYLPSVYTYCMNIKVWGDTATWERTLDELKPDIHRVKVRKGDEEAEKKKAIVDSLVATLPDVENTCGRVVTAYASGNQLMSNKGGNCVPFQKLHEVIYRIEYETSEADSGRVENETLAYSEASAESATKLTYRDMFCGEEYSYTNSKFTFRQMSYLWDHIQGGSATDNTVSSGSEQEQFRPDAASAVPTDYFKFENSGGSFPLRQRYSMKDRSFCFIDWIGDFSGSSTRLDSYGDEYVDPYLLYSREIDEAIWNTDIAIASKKQVAIDNMELWDVLESQLTNPVDGNILNSLSHAATAHFMKVTSTDEDKDLTDYTQFFNQD